MISSYSQCPADEHIENIRQVLTLLNVAEVAKAQNFEVFTNWKDYLGHVLKRGYLAVISGTIHTTCCLQTLSIITNIRWFLGLCNAFHRLVPKFARITDLLNRQLRKNQSRGPIRQGVIGARKFKGKVHLIAGTRPFAIPGKIYGQQ